MGPSLVRRSLAVSLASCCYELWRGCPEGVAKILWSSRSSLSYYSGSSFLLAILWFWNCTSVRNCYHTAWIEDAFVQSLQSYFCRAARGYAFSVKAFYHDRHPPRSLWCHISGRSCLFSLFCLINLHCLTPYTQTWVPNVFQKLNERVRPLFLPSALLCKGQLDDKPISFGNILKTFVT